MQEPEEWIGSLPEDIYWSDRGDCIYFRWNPENEVKAPLYKVDTTSGNPVKVGLKKEMKLPSRSGDLNEARTRKVYVKNGNLFIHYIKKDNIQLLLNSKDNIGSPAFSKDDESVIFVMDQCLYEYRLDTHKLNSILVFREGHAPDDNKNTGNQHDQWLEDQQMELFSTLRKRKKKQEQLEELNKKMEPDLPKQAYTGRGRAVNIRLSPDKRFVTYHIYQGGDRKSSHVPHFVTGDGYVDWKQARPKVGGDGYSYDLYIYDLERDTSYALVTKNIPGIKDQPEYLKEYDAWEKEGDPRKVHAFGPYWSDDGQYALISVRSEDNKDRWLMLLDPVTGEPELLDRQRDEAWIAGPGITRSGWGEKLGWMPDNKRIWFQSEESGYAHLYTVNVETGIKKALTAGNFEIYNPRTSKDEKYWYLSANKIHPGERHLYRMPLNGGKLTRLTFMEGRNDVVLSPDEKYMAIRHSYANQPWELYIKKNKLVASPVKITRSLTDSFRGYEWRKPEIVTFKANDGAMIYARLYKPDEYEFMGPAVIFVHGAGYLQNAHKWWSNYFREYMFHNILVDNGYTVLDIDYRGSAGYGRDWRTAIYRHMGGKDLSDQVDGAEYFVDQHHVDPERIGIYGGSYGGFITLMALFKEPLTFAAGAALRSVTDWAHYNDSYTSNILNDPVSDSLAYKRSSPIYFAEGLEDPLLMCHGMVDHNVQFQDIVRLSQRLIELGKNDWELAVYPLEPHSFKEPESWTDEYKRIFKLFQEHLKK